MFIIMIILTMLVIVLFPLSKYLYNNKFFNYALFEKMSLINKKYKLTYLISVFFSVITITLYFVVRWFPVLIGVIQEDIISQQVSEFRSSNLSILFALDLCSLLGILMPMLVIFNWKTKKFLISLSPLAILGATLTILFTCSNMYMGVWDAKQFFIGVDKLGLSYGLGSLVFSLHFWILVIGYGALVWGRKYTKKHFYILAIYVICYIIYVNAIGYGLDIRTHVTASVKGEFIRLDDWYYESPLGIIGDRPTYGIFTKIFPFQQWWAVGIFAWISFCILVGFIILIRNLPYLINFKHIRNKYYL